MTRKCLSKLTALALGTALIASTAVWAGELVSDTDVVVDYLNGVAHGVFSNPGAQQSIGCDIVATWDFESGQLIQSISCSAADAFGATLGCTSADPNFVRVVRLLRSRGWLRFAVDPAALSTEQNLGACQILTVGISSTVLHGQLNRLP